MNFLDNEVPSVGNITSPKVYARNCPDLKKVGRDIYDLLNVLPKKRQAWKRRVVSVEIKPDHLYSPQEVAAVLRVATCGPIFKTSWKADRNGISILTSWPLLPSASAESRLRSRADLCRTLQIDKPPSRNAAGMDSYRAHPCVSYGPGVAVRSRQGRRLAGRARGRFVR
jgi:hypothetical protein